MKQEPQPGKRIVSKGEYIAVQTSRAVLRTSALVSVAEVAICAILVLCLPFMNFGLLGWLASLFFAIMGFRLSRVGLGKLKQIAQLEEVLPLTQANTALLPPTQTLVRAASPPPQELQHVLLRATDEEHKTPADQLLRSVDDLAHAANVSASDTWVAPRKLAPVRESISQRMGISEARSGQEEQLLQAAGQNES